MPGAFQRRTTAGPGFAIVTAILQVGKGMRVFRQGSGQRPRRGLFLFAVDGMLLDAFAPVARDLRAAGLDCQLTDDTSGEPGIGAELIVSGVKLGRLALEASVFEPARVAGLAVQAQELVQANLGSFGKPVEWPSCLPSHVHSMAVAMGADAALWVCPLDASISVPIGSHP